VVTGVAFLTISFGGVAQAVPPEAVVTVEAFPPVEPIARGEIAEVEIMVEILPGWHINSHQPDLVGLIATELLLTPPNGLEVSKVIYPDPVEKELPWAEVPLALYEGRVVIRVLIAAAEELPPGELTLPGTLRYQACNDEVCLPPEEIPVTIPLQIVPTLGTVPEASEKTETTSPPGIIGPLLEERGLALVLVAVFLLGLGINLTPCVYPLIPVTVAYFGRGVGGTLHTLSMALAYQLGLSLTYSGLGVLAALTGQLFGVLLRKPWVPALAATVLVLLALSFFGLYQLRPPRFLTRRLPQGKTGLPAAFLMGLFVGAVVAPCVGPATVALLSYVSLTQDVALGFVLFFVFALGLGAPYVALALLASKVRNLPRGGAWTVWVERVLGFVLLGTALYFLAPLLPRQMTSWTAGGLAIAGGVYLGWLEPSKGGKVFRIARRAIGLAGVTLGVLAFLPKEEGPGLAWEPYSSEALQEEGSPVLLYFYADWCLPCKELAATTFRDPRVIQALQGWLLLKVDLTRDTGGQASQERDLLRRFQVAGVPTLILLGPAGEQRTMVGYIGPESFLEEVTALALGKGGTPQRRPPELKGKQARSRAVRFSSFMQGGRYEQVVCVRFRGVVWDGGLGSAEVSGGSRGLRLRRGGGRAARKGRVHVDQRRRRAACVRPPAVHLLRLYQRPAFQDAACSRGIDGARGFA